MTILPPEAGTTYLGPFEPNDEWLATASKELQIEAMWRWFLDRYEDPANETPWDGEDKQYVFVWGGPYDPNDEIQSRFSGVVQFETMRELITNLWREAGDEWAPIHREGGDYEDYVGHRIVVNRDDPLRFLEERIAEILAVLDAVTLDGTNRRLLHQMAHSSLIAALEAYLADTVTYWIDADDYLADLIWHRLDKIKPMLASGLKIKVPDIGDLMKEVLVRHDIVHRAGRRRDGSLVDLDIDDLKRVRDAIRQFTEAIETELAHRFPAKKHNAADDPLSGII